MIKRFMVLATMLLVAVALAGCGGDKAVDEPVVSEPVPAPTAPENDVEEVSTRPTDMSPVSLNDVFFDFDAYNLTSEAKSTLESNARELKRVADAGITIEGHCDERGTKAYNLALGEKRASAAKDYLVTLGVTASRINTISYGKERPFENGSNESAWAKNRRAHFVSN